MSALKFSQIQDMLINLFIINKLINKINYNFFKDCLKIEILRKLDDYNLLYSSNYNGSVVINKYLSQFKCCLLYKPEYYHCYCRCNIIRFEGKQYINRINSTYLKSLEILIDELLDINNSYCS